MDWRELSSSVIARVAYSEASRTLTMEFRSGTTYQYYDVPPTTYQEFIEAASAGGYFADHIRGVYRFARIGTSDAVD